jgi:hypothetical protein
VAASVELTTTALHQVAQAYTGGGPAHDHAGLSIDDAQIAYAALPEPTATPASGPAGTLVINDFTGSSLVQIEQAIFPAAQAAIASNTIRELFRLRMLWAACYCPDCDCVYCADHWQVLPAYNDDGWYQCLYGVCPHKHRRILGD